ncbi:BRCT domain-containing protein [Vigna angularis]|uniref:BRCT domain-containing protein n=1 Tax=Phaseolus angularis TaxID=3914 RepID=A0A8T0JUL2_PHAAN|nr:BRCT domain-containing protein [Vigna angularis]
MLKKSNSYNKERSRLVIEEVKAKVVVEEKRVMFLVGIVRWLETNHVEEVANSPVQGMESVVATVSGYHGSERFDLIKLISHAGANYVGTMSKSITHLVCWKFEGKKYDIALKFRIPVVNHQWIEDCIKEGRRVPEDSYTLQSGHEVGRLLLEVPVTVRTSRLTQKKIVSDKLHDTGTERQKPNFGSGISIAYVLEDSCLMKKHDESTSYSSRLSKKGKRNICNGKGVITLAGPSRKGRRLTRNLDDVVLAPSILDLSSDDHLFKADRLQTDAKATSSLSGGLNNNTILQNSEGPNAGLSTENRIIDGGSDDIEQIKDSVPISTLRNSTLFVEDALRVPQTSIDLCSSDEEKFTDGDQVDNGAGLPTSTEMSCVICFTDFSTTRGILPCGHRFCFPCIQSWVDHRSTQTGACVICRGREPEDLLENCDICQIQKIHSYCMDPPLRPWTCNHCKELRMLYRTNHY